MGKRLTIKAFVEKARQLHNDKYDYSQAKYISSRTKLIIICPEHGKFEQLPSSHLQGNGCPKCARVWSDEHRQNLQKSLRMSRGISTRTWIDRAKHVHGDKYDYSQTVYINKRTDVKIICPVHGMFEQKADSHIRGYGCKLCGFESENHIGVHSWSDEQREKIRNTCQKKYGTDRYLDSVDGKEKLSEIKSTLEFRDKMRAIISSDKVQEKTRQTSLKRYGVTSAMKLSEITDKVSESKRKNGSWSTSKPEEDMYAYLCQKFGQDDIVRQYKELRYPFHCDFYIKSLDLFVELNATWLHGGHWFNEHDVNDLAVLHQWSQSVQSGKRFYGVAIDVWTRRDLLKYQTAIRNQLNYVVFWNNNLSDFMNWLEADSPVLNNIL